MPRASPFIIYRVVSDAAKGPRKLAEHRCAEPRSGAKAESKSLRRRERKKRAKSAMEKMLAVEGYARRTAEQRGKTEGW